jgi:hypothetical protein
MIIPVNSEKKFVIIALIGGFAALGGIVAFAGQGYVRHVNIFWPEEIRQTLEFRNVDGNTVVVGTVGNSGTNPDLISRTEFAYILTIINADTKPHLFYVDTVELKTKLLEPGQFDTITIVSKKETTLRYYDIAEQKLLLGTIQIKKVTLTE